jgi:hypothetical protein
MKYQEIYQGHTITIITSKQQDGLWHSHAELPDAGGAVAPSQAYRSEDEAHRAALSAAMAVIDRNRARIGKP